MYLPPLTEVAAVNRAGRLDEYQRTGEQHLGQRSGIVLGSRRDFGEGDMTGLTDESRKAFVSDRRAVYPEAVHRHQVRRSFLRIMIVRSHAEGTAGNPDQL